MNVITTFGGRNLHVHLLVMTMDKSWWQWNFICLVSV